MIANAICLCAQHLPSDETLKAMAARTSEIARLLIDETMSSIPYILLKDLDQAISTSSNDVQVGAPAGGILLMHPLHIITTLTAVVPPEQRAYMAGCLAWISQYMAIGQAAELHQMGAIGSTKSVGDAHMIVWAGMLM